MLSDSRDPTKPSKLEEYSRFPLVIRPATRTSRFFDRSDVVEKMNAFFSKAESERSFLSLALYGLGGVGKSSIAMKFAEDKLERRELDCIFWVHSEKPVSIRQSFTDIAMRLKLPDAQPKDHDENHALVLNWLQQTRELPPVAHMILH
jgi:KaiC/GvpD/RAD55 family RecA-like ATPase